MNAPRQLPPDINIEVLLSYYQEGQFKVAMHGLHKRNTYNDIVETEEASDGTLHVSVGRNSLYNSLPECMFHPTDRFDNIPQSEMKERFAEEVERQEEEERKARLFFAPLDVLLLKLRAGVHDRIERYARENTVIEDILGDSLTAAQRQNRFVRQAMEFLPHAKHIRGNQTLITLMLRKIFREEGLLLCKATDRRTLTDAAPRYGDSVGAEIDNAFVGNTYSDRVTSYTLHYWSDELAAADFLTLLDEIETFRVFVRDFFLAIGEELTFDLTHDEPPLRLSDEVFHNYLNYNTNI